MITALTYGGKKPPKIIRVLLKIEEERGKDVGGKKIEGWIEYKKSDARECVCL